MTTMNSNDSDDLSSETTIQEELSAANEGSFADTPFFANAAMPKKESSKVKKEPNEVTRREWTQTSLFLVVGAVIGGATIVQQPPSIPAKTETPLKIPLESPLKTSNSKQNKAESPLKVKSGTPTTTANTNRTKIVPDVGKLEPLNLTQVVKETNVNVTMNCPEGCVSVDSNTFTKVKSAKVPNWLPSWLTPRPKVIKEISNTDLLVAATIAGSSIDLMRTSLLYPIQTIKTRVQTDIHNYTNSPPPIESRLANLGTNIKRHVDEGNLYAGIRPSLLVSVPATGVYFGVRDVTKRMLGMTVMNNAEIALLAALVADIISLCFRAPADALTLRLQNLDEDVGDWFGDSIKRLPSIILTDIPYLITKISINRLLIHGNISMDRYLEYAILATTISALLTTPFDVARTRILVDSDGNFANGMDGGSGEGLLETMRSIAKEGDGGAANLFAGWFERVLYLGLGRAW